MAAMASRDSRRRVTIDDAGPAELPAIREMLQEYRDWVGADLSFQGFAREVQGLPGDYVRPDGRLLIARLDAEAAGMVAMRRLDASRAEMKRLYVRPTARGARIGHELVARIIDAAREGGYQSIVLDTLPVMQSAQRLYAEFGFVDIAPYYESPLPGTRYLGLTLR
jgi:ribosomal protein S18 acetylase RimI-like enzyme